MISREGATSRQPDNGRKVRMYSLFNMLGLLFRVLIHGMDQLRRREGLDLWYGGKREEAGEDLRDPIKSPPPGPGSP